MAPETLKFPALIGRCFCCKQTTLFDASTRFCSKDGCAASSRVKPITRDLYVTILPERVGNYGAADLPDLETSKDFFARFVPGEKADGLLLAAPSNPCPVSDLLPYKNDGLANLGLRLGQPTLYRLEDFEKWAGFERIWVLDMSTYLWSHTLKDVRSWAILNAALEAEAHHLALYTAGNAGISLAQLAYVANRRLPGPKRFHIHCLVDDRVPKVIRALLKLWDCEVIQIQGNGHRILNPERVREEVNRQARGFYSDSPPNGYWHVTDGWDGVGLTMYRLLFAQVLRKLKLDYVVAPVGTGSLFLGSYLGLKDSHLAKHSVRLVGAVPFGENVITNIRDQDIPLGSVPRGSEGDEPAVMPKLVGRYTPLAPCFGSVEEAGEMEFVAVPLRVQKDVARMLATQRAVRRVGCEPSALASLGALRALNAKVREERDPTFPAYRPYQAHARVLVVNSGLGVVGDEEAAFVESSF